MLEEKKKKFQRPEKVIHEVNYSDGDEDANILKMPNTFNLLREKRKFEEEAGKKVSDY